MTFRLSRRSLRKLKGVDPKLVYLVKVAITKTNVDFGVVCGLRTMKEQIELVEQGASKTYKSKILSDKNSQKHLEIQIDDMKNDINQIKNSLKEMSGMIQAIYEFQDR